jgi:hypothetical protein
VASTGLKGAPKSFLEPGPQRVTQSRTRLLVGLHDTYTRRSILEQFLIAFRQSMCMPCASTQSNARDTEGYSKDLSGISKYSVMRRKMPHLSGGVHHSQHFLSLSQHSNIPHHLRNAIAIVGTVTEDTSQNSFSS